MMSIFYPTGEYLFYDLIMAVLFQVHLREEPIEYSHRERKAEPHVESSSLIMARANIVLHIRSSLDVSVSMS